MLLAEVAEPVLELSERPLGLHADLAGAAYQSRAAIRADRAAAAGDNDEARRQLGRWAVGYGVIVLLLVAATWDMVFKPGR